MFNNAKSFNVDISHWDVSSVGSMNDMFLGALMFKQKLCGVFWIRSYATKNNMFQASPGVIAASVCFPATASTTLEHVPHHPFPERELIVRTPVATSVGTPTIPSTSAKAMTCPQCGTFKKSGRTSCCAPGGAWYKNCAGAGNKNAYYRWFEGVEACKRESKTTSCR